MPANDRRTGEKPMRKYCANCTNWDWAMHIPSNNTETGGCSVETGVDENHPIKPTATYLNYAEANKDGDCEHYEDKGEGLGLAKPSNNIEFTEDSDEKEARKAG